MVRPLGNNIVLCNHNKFCCLGLSCTGVGEACRATNTALAARDAWDAWGDLFGD